MIRRGQPRRTHTFAARAWAEANGYTAPGDAGRLPPAVLDAWHASGRPSPRRPHGREPLRERASAARRMDPIDLAGTRDPWTPRHCRCIAPGRKGLDSYAAALLHLASHGVPAAISRPVARAIWEHHPALRDHLDRLAETTEPNRPGCPGWLTDPVCEGQCRT